VLGGFGDALYSSLLKYEWYHAVRLGQKEIKNKNNNSRIPNPSPDQQK
jgi:hypothetical protein